jgi:hypothetical protein
MKLKLFFVLPMLVLCSCHKDEPTPINPNDPTGSPGKKIYVINEGNYGSNNASITLFDTGNASNTEDYFKQQNGVGLGDVAQSMTLINGDFYIVVNHSNKIVVCGSDLKVKRTITGFVSPRYIVPVSSTKAYVSDLWANGVSIVDLVTGTRTGSIALPGKTEQMVFANNKVFVTNTDRDKIYVINTTSNLISDSITVGINAGSMVLDKNNKLWVLSSGTSSVTGRLCQIDPGNHAIVSSHNFTPDEKAGLLCINGTKDTLWYANKNGVCRMPITSAALPSIAFISSTLNIYGLAVHPTRYEVYVADANDYTSRSTIYAYKTSNAVLYGTFKAGLISNGFYFEP